MSDIIDVLWKFHGASGIYETKKSDPLEFTHDFVYGC